MAGFDCFQKELCAILCLKEDESWPLTESVFFVELNSEIFLLRFLSSLLKSILIVTKLCFLIDDNMHWALIDSFLWYSFCIHDYSFISGCFLAACYYCFQKASCNFVPQGNAWLWLSLFFGDLNTWIFLTLLSLLFFNRSRWWWNCAF